MVYSQGMSKMMSPKMYTVKITAGFERNNRYVGRYETVAEAVSAARYMKSKGIGGGGHYVAVPIWEHMGV